MLPLLNHKKAAQLIGSLVISIAGCKWAAGKTFKLSRFPKEVCPNSGLAVMLGPLLMLGE